MKEHKSHIVFGYYVVIQKHNERIIIMTDFVWKSNDRKSIALSLKVQVLKANLMTFINNSCIPNFSIDWKGIAQENVFSISQCFIVKDVDIEYWC